MASDNVVNDNLACETNKFRNVCFTATLQQYAYGNRHFYGLKPSVLER